MLKSGLIGETCHRLKISVVFFSVAICSGTKPDVIRFAGQARRVRIAREPYLTEKGKTLEPLGINKKGEV